MWSLTGKVGAAGGGVQNLRKSAVAAVVLKEGQRATCKARHALLARKVRAQGVQQLLGS